MIPNDKVNHEHILVWLKINSSGILECRMMDKILTRTCESVISINMHGFTSDCLAVLSDGHSVGTYNYKCLLNVQLYDIE